MVDLEGEGNSISQEILASGLNPDHSIKTNSFVVCDGWSGKSPKKDNAT